ncbi:hypothetical protein BMS3Bbin07_00600 [bacterium BMS3Bbin07]|nr:hypothetical protein BMS3Bbin07_00600 [bacterium BMS3Bbin07]
MTDPQKPSMETIVIRRFRLIPNLSTIADVNASIIEMEEERPATTRHRKKIAPKIFPPGIRLTAFGYATKARPILCETTPERGSPCVVAIKPRTENTATPANNE